VGGADPVHRGPLERDRVFLVVSVGRVRMVRRSASMYAKDYAVPFIAAFTVCAIAFLALDVLVMNMQGLSLIFRQ
jgi:hypothetical protein